MNYSIPKIKNHYLPLFFSFIVFLLSSCKKEYDRASELVLDKAEVNVFSDSSANVIINSGNGGYSVTSTNANIATATVAENTITITAAKEVTNAQTIIVITDQYYKRASIIVHVSKQGNIVLDKDSIVLSSQQAKDTLRLIAGIGNYQVSFSDKNIAKAVIRDSIIEITGKQQGSTELTIVDENGGKKTIPIKVNGADYALKLGTDYFGYADFKGISVVNTTIKQEKQVTFEITCKLNGYRGLQTFLGLENNLIIRGKNDDYLPSHPIAIAGLHDSIMLESKSSFDLNKWINIALVVDCEQTDVLKKYKLYINGIQDELIVDKNTGTHTYVNLASSGDNNLFEIGRAAGQDFRAMNGTVSEARVWTTIRTQDQIKKNMCSLTETNPTGLLARWKFSAGAATNYIQDVSGNQYESNLILSNVGGGSYGQIVVPASAFVERGCPQ